MASNYAGYRLKINGTVFPNHYMQRGSWSCLPHKRLVRSWYDANGTLHEDYHEANQVEISFKIRESNLEDHEKIVPFFTQHENVLVDYWDDEACVYKRASCKISHISWLHTNAIHSDVLYRAAQVYITSYQGGYEW